MDELNDAGLKLFFNEDIYLIDEPEKANAVKEPVASEELKEPEAPSLVLNYKGGNAKDIIIITNDESNEFIASEDETLLLNILKAVGFSLEDVAIINSFNTGIEWQEQLEFAKVIGFGVEPSSYNLTTEKYSIHSHENVQWLFSHSLAELAATKEFKGKLWLKLQELF